MGYTNFPNGITSFGVPVLGGTAGTGLVAFRKVYFVDRTYGNDDNNGLATGTGNAFKTVQAGLDVVRDQDAIIVLPSSTYNEQLTTGLAAGTPTTVPDAPAGQGRYVTLMGASSTKWAFDSPQLYNVDGSTATLSVQSPGFRVSGFRIISDAGSPIGVYAGIAGASSTSGSVWSAGLQVDNNVFYGAVGSATGLTMQAVMNFRILENQFDYFASTNYGAITNATGGFDTYPRGHIMGNIFTNCKDNIVAPYGSTVISNNIIADNHVNPVTRGIILTGGTSNTVCWNVLGGADYGSAMYIAASGDNWSGNVTIDDGATNILTDTPWTQGNPAT
jgi:hypothetical protein